MSKEISHLPSSMAAPSSSTALPSSSTIPSSSGTALPSSDTEPRSSGMASSSFSSTPSSSSTAQSSSSTISLSFSTASSSSGTAPSSITKPSSSSTAPSSFSTAPSPSSSSSSSITIPSSSSTAPSSSSTTPPSSSTAPSSSDTISSSSNTAPPSSITLSSSFNTAPSSSGMPLSFISTTPPSCGKTHPINPAPSSSRETQATASPPSCTIAMHPSLKYGLKIIKMHWTVARPVMREVLIMGCPNKPPHQDFITYLKSFLQLLNANTLQSSHHPSTANTTPLFTNNIQPLSPPNYTTATNHQRRFDKTQRTIIEKSLNGEEFDISILFKCIQLMCVGMAPLGDPAWHTKGPLLENYLFIIKRQRNRAMHESPEITETTFLTMVSDLRQVLINTLHAAQLRYVHNMTTAERDHLIQHVNNELDNIMTDSVDDSELINQCLPTLLQEVIIEAPDELRETFRFDGIVTLLEFVRGVGGEKLELAIQEIFTQVNMLSGKKLDAHTEMDYKDMLSLVQSGDGKPQVLVVEGPAGMGKTTLVTLLMKEWLDGGHGTIKGLDDYHLVLKIQCRDPHLTSFKNLLENLMPKVSYRYRNFLPHLVKQCRLLVIIDGYDEVNMKSRQLIEDLLHTLKHAPNCTLLCTTRPEALVNLSHVIPHEYEWSVVELTGIPPDLRSEFVRRYFGEIKRVTSTSRSGQELVQKVEKDKYKEHYKIPLNLAILAWLFYYDPKKATSITTQTELYHLTHLLCQEKLEDRLTHHDKTKNMEKSERLDKVEAWLPHLYLNSFETLSRNELNFGKEAIRSLRYECDKLNLPRTEVLAAFLTMRTTSIHGKAEEQLCVAHKGLHEYYGALHIIRSLKRKPTSTITAVIRKSVRANQGKVQNFLDTVKAWRTRCLDLQKYINLLKQLTGLLHFYMDPVPSHMVKEVIKLLIKAGARSRNDWLDILEEVKATPDVLTAIATVFPTKDEIVVKEGRVSVYSVLLPHLPPTQVIVKVRGDPTPLLPALTHHNCSHVVVSEDLVNHQIFLARIPPTQVIIQVDDDPIHLLPGVTRHSITVVVGNHPINHKNFLAQIPPAKVVLEENGDHSPLVPAMARHSCNKLNLSQNWYHPHPTPTPDSFLLDFLSKDGLKKFVGQGTVGLVKLPATLTHLYLAVADDDQATTLLPLLHSLKRLKLIHVHVGAAVSEGAINTTLPDLKDVVLHLTDVGPGGESRVCQVTVRLQPPKGYLGLAFPRCSLQAEGLRRVVEWLAEEKVQVRWGVMVPEPSAAHDTQLDTLAKDKLGAFYGFSRSQQLSDWESAGDSGGVSYSSPPITPDTTTTTTTPLVTTPPLTTTTPLVTTAAQDTSTPLADKHRHCERV